VFFGLVTAWRLADCADQHFAVLGERDDRRRGAVAFAVLDDAALPPSMTATQELVVPRSMPMILPMWDLKPRFAGDTAPHGRGQYGD
jgi:hypothetical protein